jgi:site-specific DNA-methyltransferase (adenine-specific)
MTAWIESGDCRAVLSEIEDDHFDAVVTDPPYGLSFMGKGWDHGVPGGEFWTRILRVAKPGAHLLAFGGTRTHHRLMVAIEDAGWEIRDCLMWLHGQGFPKSQNVAKMMAKKGMAEADDWEGWGTALKPSWEPIVLARKPFTGTVVNNVVAHNTGAMNIDATRIATTDAFGGGAGMSNTGEAAALLGQGGYEKGDGWVPGAEGGRFPANLMLAHHSDCDPPSIEKWDCHPDCPVGMVDEQAGDVGSGAGNTGAASRFFYVAKASKAERSTGLPEGVVNKHPTVKPVELMRYLIRLVTPLGGIVLDPFCGSGSTGVAAVEEGFAFMGIDDDEESVEWASARLRSAVEAQAES